MNNNQQFKKMKTYKIEVGDTIKVYKKIINGYTFYTVRVPQLNMNGQTQYFNKEIGFKKGVQIANGEYITIKSMVENIRKNEKDPFHPISSLVILDFEKKESEDKFEQEAINEYKSYVDILQDDRDYYSSISDEF